MVAVNGTKEHKDSSRISFGLFGFSYVTYHTSLTRFTFLFCQEYVRIFAEAPKPQAAHFFFLMW